MKRGDTLPDKSLFGAADAVAAVTALLLGCGIGFVDSRATWDDAGVTALALVVAAGLVSLARPRRWLPIGVVVGVPAVAFNVARFGRWDSLLAVGFAVVGAAIGGSIGRVLRRAVA